MNCTTFSIRINRKIVLCFINNTNNVLFNDLFELKMYS